MQYLQVDAKNIKTGEMIDSLVLIDKVENGCTGTVLVVDPGVYSLSVKENGAETRTVLVDNTTQENPLSVIIEVDSCEEQIKKDAPEKPLWGPPFVQKFIGMLLRSNKKG